MTKGKFVVHPGSNCQSGHIGIFCNFTVGNGNNIPRYTDAGLYVATLNKSIVETPIRTEKFTSADFAFYYQLVGNEQVMAMITERAIPLEEAKQDFDRLLQNNALHPDFGSFKIMDALSNQFIGLAKLEINEKHSEEAELGYIVLPAYWGKGIAGMAAKQLIELAKAQNTLKKLFAIIDPQNIPSRKILVKNGFVSKEYKDFDGLPGEVLEFRL